MGVGGGIHILRPYFHDQAVTSLFSSSPPTALAPLFLRAC